MFEHVRITTLPNGAKIATSAMPGVNSFSVCFSVGMGSRFERSSEAGWSHFLEHMIFKGSRRHPTRTEIVRPLERIGAEYNAETGHEETSFHARVPASKTALAVGILGDMFSHPLCPSSEIERERKVVLEEIKRSEDSPDGRIFRAARAAIWPGHSLGRPISGNPTALEQADADALLDFHHRNYAAPEVLVSAAGALDHERIVEMVRPHLENLANNPVRRKPKSRFRPVRPLVAERRDVKQVNAIVAFRIPELDNENRDRLALLANILGGGMDSRLFRRIRDQNGMAYSIHAASHHYKGTGMFYVKAGLDPTRVEKAVALIGQEIRAMAERPVSNRELADTKGLLTGWNMFFGETSEEQRLVLQGSLRNRGFVMPPEQWVKGLRSITREQIQTLAADIIRPETCTLALILPNDCKADPEKLREALFNG